MQRVRVKICGLRTEADVAAVAAAGAAYAGFVFFAKSPRNVELAQATGIARALPPFLIGFALVMPVVHAALALLAHDAGQIQGERSQSQQHHATHHKAGHQQHETDEGDLHPPRRIYQHHIAGVVASGQRQRHSKHANDQ